MMRFLPALMIAAVSTVAFAQTAQQPAPQAAPQAAPQEALPSATALFDKYVAATGGKAAYEKISSRVVSGTIEVTTFGANGTIEQYAKAPSMVLTSSHFEGYGDVLQGYDGKSAWMSTPDQGVVDVPAAQAELVKRQADFHRSIHLSQHYPKAAVTGKAKVGDRDAYVVEGTTASGATDKMYFDTETGLLVKSEIKNEQNDTVATELQDYKEFDGVKMPTTIKQDSPQISFLIKFQDVKNNVPIEDSKFAKPAAK